MNSWPGATETVAKMRVAGARHTASPGSSVTVGDSGQAPDAMSLFVCTTMQVSLVVSQ